MPLSDTNNSVLPVLKQSPSTHLCNIPVSSHLSFLFHSSVSRCAHGLCVLKGQSYSCKCNEGYQGQFCDRRQEPAACRGQRCGHGECRVSESGEPVCQCQPGYTGPTCDAGNIEMEVKSKMISRCYDFSVNVMFVVSVLH